MAEQPSPFKVLKVAILMERTSKIAGHVPILTFNLSKMGDADAYRFGVLSGCTARISLGMISISGEKHAPHICI